VVLIMRSTWHISRWCATARACGLLRGDDANHSYQQMFRFEQSTSG
jgi:hypothetical protein